MYNNIFFVRPFLKCEMIVFMKASLLSVLLCCSCICFSQTDNLVLFQKGTVLEYQTYLPKVGMFGKQKGYFETTRLTYSTERVVTDSGAGIKKATIVKSGAPYAETKKELHWQTEMDIELGNETVKFPPIFYYADTIYLCDVYTIKGPRQKMVYSATTMEGGGSTNYSFLQNNFVNLENEEYKVSAFIKDPIAAEGGAFVAGKSNPDTYASKVIVRTKTISSNNEGKVKIRVPAGIFECDKIVKAIEVTMGRRSKSVKIIYYISPEIGLVKTESLEGELHTGYTELVRIRKGKAL